MNFSSIVAAGIMGLATLASQSETFQVRFKPVAEHQAQLNPRRVAFQPLDEVRTIELKRIVLTDGPATGFNQLMPRQNTAFQRGERIDIYFEPTNLATRYEAGYIHASMTVDLEIRNDVGDVVARERGAWKVPLVVAATHHQPLTNIFAAMSTRSINLAPGRYQLKLRIHDDFGGISLERGGGITVLNGQPQPTVSHHRGLSRHSDAAGATF